ncbi:type II secretion system F family protein [Paenibacillus terreus]|uniref:Type II secretion system F family protein n=1 Tax=Paenibacillus terreus TaxID=1387834 RepID=A0ABV5BD66_9BACL
MTFLLLLSFIGLSVGILLLLRLSPRQLLQELADRMQHRQTRKLPIGRKIRTVQQPKKLKGWRATIAEATAILQQTGNGQRLGWLSVLSLSLAVGGSMLALLLGNVWLLPVLACGFALLPFWLVLFTATFYKKRLHAELETALSVITTSYLRSENIISAVEENLPYLHPPVFDVFQAFLAESKLIHTNLRLALTQLRGRIDNSVFQEWCDALMACQEDRTLKTTLMPIVSKLSDIRVVSAELDVALYEPFKEFLTMALLLIGNIPLLYFLNRDWYRALMHTTPGHIVLALCALTLLISLAAVIRLMRPLEYKR